MARPYLASQITDCSEKAFESRPSNDCAGFSVAATLDCLSNQVMHILNCCWEQHCFTWKVAVSTSKFFETESVKVYDSMIVMSSNFDSVTNGMLIPLSDAAGTQICAQNTSVAWEPLNTCATSHQVTICVICPVGSVCACACTVLGIRCKMCLHVGRNSPENEYSCCSTDARQSVQC